MIRRLVRWLLIPRMLLVQPAVAWAEPGDEGVRSALKEVYARPEFNPSDGDYGWLSRLLAALGRLFGAMGAAAPLLFWLVVAVCVGLLLLLALYLAGVVKRSVYIRSARDRTSHAEERRRLSAQYRAEANAHAQAGDYTAAVRALFLSLVYAFDETGRLLFQPALTNREYLRGFSDRPALAEDLRVYVDLLDANWYGQQPTTAHDYEECLALYATVQGT